MESKNAIDDFPLLFPQEQKQQAFTDPGIDAPTKIAGKHKKLRLKPVDYNSNTQIKVPVKTEEIIPTEQLKQPKEPLQSKKEEIEKESDSEETNQDGEQTQKKKRKRRRHKKRLKEEGDHEKEQSEVINHNIDKTTGSRSKSRETKNHIGLNTQAKGQSSKSEPLKTVVQNKQLSEKYVEKNAKNTINNSKLRNAGYYSKINYNLSEIIESKLIRITDHTKTTTSAKQKNQDSNAGKSATNSSELHATATTGIRPFANTFKELEEKKKNSQAVLDHVSKEIEDTKLRLQNVAPSSSAVGWDAEVLTVKELSDRAIKTKLLTSKIKRMEDKRNILIEERKAEESAIVAAQQARKKLRYIRKMQRLSFLKNISKEVAIYKISKGIPKPSIKQKYKAVPAYELEFDLILKKKKKVSKIKDALQQYLNQKKESSKLKGDTQKKNEQKGDDQFYETVDEDGCSEGEENDEEIEEEKSNEIVSRPTTEKHVYQLPRHINPAKNLEGVKYNNMFLRSWVDHIPSNEIDSEVLVLVNRLSYMQTMKKLRQPKKSKKRIVAGFNEVLKTVNTNVKDKQSKCLIFALNLQNNPLDNGSDQIVFQLLEFAHLNSIPVVHSCSRTKLGKAVTGKFGPRVSVVSILNYEAEESSFSRMLELTANQRELYKTAYPL